MIRDTNVIGISFHEAHLAGLFIADRTRIANFIFTLFSSLDDLPNEES